MSSKRQFGGRQWLGRQYEGSLFRGVGTAAVVVGIGASVAACAVYVPGGKASAVHEGGVKRQGVYAPGAKAVGVES